MSNTPQSPTKVRPGSRDTGFPEPFCGQRNTTLPHPDANLSPNAVISQDDIPIDRVHSRTKRSFLQKYKRTISHGIITPQMEAMYSELALDDASCTAGVESESGEGTRSMSSAGRPSKDGNDSILSHSMGDVSPTTSDVPRRSSLLRRLRWHK